MYLCNDLGNAECVQFLIDNGANVNASDNVDDTPLHVVGFSRLGSRREKEECSRILIEAGADLEAKSKVKDTPLDLQFFQNLKQKKPQLFQETI